MSAHNYFLGIDAGQTVVKAVIHDENLNQVSLARRQSPMSTQHPRWLERTQDALWVAAREAIAEAINVAGINPSDIAGVGISGHGDGLHLIDDAGNSVGPAIMAVDSRAFAEMEEINSDAPRAQRILEASGQVPFLGSPGVLLKWTSIHEPERIEKASKMLACKDVLRLKLTGEVATDFSDASASFLNVNEARWDPQVLNDYGLSGLERLLPPLISSLDIAGYITEDAAKLTGLRAGTPVVGGAHDVQCTAIGMGSLEEEVLTLIAGSFSINAVTTREPHTDPRWQSRLSIVPDLRMAMSTSATASTSLEWLLRLVGATDSVRRDELFAEASAIPNSESLPTMLPYLYASPFGERPSGTFAGIRGWHTPAHMLKATLEGIISMHVWHTNALADAFAWKNTVRLGGGMANSGYYAQLVADALNENVEVVKNDETGAFGAASLAAMATGHFGSLEDVKNKVATSPAKHPRQENRAYWEDRLSRADQLTDDLSQWWDSEA